MFFLNKLNFQKNLPKNRTKGQQQGRAPFSNGDTRNQVQNRKAQEMEIKDTELSK